MAERRPPVRAAGAPGPILAGSRVEMAWPYWRLFDPLVNDSWYCCVRRLHRPARQNTSPQRPSVGPTSAIEPSWLARGGVHDRRRIRKSAVECGGAHLSRSHGVPQTVGNSGHPRNLGTMPPRNYPPHQQRRDSRRPALCSKYGSFLGFVGILGARFAFDNTGSAGVY